MFNDMTNKSLIKSVNQFDSFQHERVRLIYKYALDHLPKDKCQDIYKNYTVHEKKFGSRAAIEDVIVSKRRFQYEEVSSKKNQTFIGSFVSFLARLAKGNVSFCHHLASIVR